MDARDDASYLLSQMLAKSEELLDAPGPVFDDGRSEGSTDRREELRR
jgi:hypothetical protein